jgi:hypothetical protein
MTPDRPDKDQQGPAAHQQAGYDRDPGQSHMNLAATRYGVNAFDANPS